MALERLLTAEELAEKLAMSPRTVIEWAKAGKIPEVRPSARIRRFDYGDVLAALKVNTATATGGKGGQQQ